MGYHHRPQDFYHSLSSLSGDVARLYLWFIEFYNDCRKDSTLREIVTILKTVLPIARTPNIVFSFQSVYNIGGKMVSKQVLNLKLLIFSLVM